MEPPDESKEEKEQRETEKLYEDSIRQKAKITHGYWLVLHLCLHALTMLYMYENVANLVDRYINT